MHACFTQYRFVVNEARTQFASLSSDAPMLQGVEVVEGDVVVYDDGSISEEADGGGGGLSPLRNLKAVTGQLVIYGAMDLPWGKGLRSLKVRAPARPGTRAATAVVLTSTCIQLRLQSVAVLPAMPLAPLAALP